MTTKEKLTIAASEAITTLGVGAGLEIIGRVQAASVAACAGLTDEQMMDLHISIAALIHQRVRAVKGKAIEA